MRSIKVNHIASPCLDWLSNNKTATLKAVLSMVSSCVETFERDEVIQLQLLVLGILNDEAGWDGALIDQGQRALLLCINLGKLKVDHWLKKLYDRSPEVCLNRKTDGRAILNLDVEASDRFATLFAAHLNLEVKII